MEEIDQEISNLTHLFEHGLRFEPFGDQAPQRNGKCHRGRKNHSGCNKRLMPRLAWCCQIVLSTLLCCEDLGHDLLEGRLFMCRQGDISTECPRTKTRNVLCTQLTQRSRDPSGLSMGEMNCVVGRQMTS
jgi:hypothetical protein